MGEDARLRAVVELAQAMAAAATPLEAARAAARRAMAALEGTFAALSVWDRAAGRLRVLVNTGELAGDEEEFPEDESYPVHEFPEITEFLHERWTPRDRAAPPGGPAPTGGDVRAGAHAWVETVAGPDPASAPGQAVPAVSGRSAALRRRGRGSCVVAPVVLHGRAWGELYVARRVGAPPFARPDADFATTLASLIAAGVAQNERLEEVRRLAFTDPLTGLANRRAVDARLEEALPGGEGPPPRTVSLAVCDVNGLKRVNDEQGHEAGDRLLIRLGAVLSLCGAMLPGSLAARLGGDEFCLLAVGPSADEAVRVAGELCVRARRLELGEGVACGVASTGDPIGPLTSPRRLFRLADAAQYRAKAAGSRLPVVAGRAAEPRDPVIELADAPTVPDPVRPGRRRRFRDAPP